jgi:zinc protease
MSVRTAPRVGSLRSFSPPDIERTRLRNGLEVLVVPRPGLPIVDVQLVCRGGGTVDPPQFAGRASLTAEMMDEGTERYSALEISDQVELLGADLELRAGWDATFCSCHGLSTRLDTIAELVAEVMLRPSFPQEEFARKHEERLHRLSQERDEPRLVAIKTLNRSVFGEHHPFGQPIGGTTRSVEALTCSTLVDYYRSAFAPATSHLVIVGDVKPKVAHALAEERFGAWSAGASTIAAGSPMPPNGRTIRLVDRPEAAQSEVRVGHVGPQRDTPDYFAVQVMNTILGGSFKSRLNMTLRERKGFTYGASSAFALRRSGGLFSVGVAVFTDNTAETLSIITGEIERIRAEAVSAEELDRARNYLALGIIRNFETTSDIAGQVADLALYDLPNSYLRELPERIASVDAAAVKSAAERNLLPEQLTMAVVGDRARVLEPLQRLELGPVEVWEAE